MNTINYKAVSTLFLFVITKLLPPVCFGILFAAVYDLWHPNSNPGILTIFICISAVFLCFLILKFSNNFKIPVHFNAYLLLVGIGLVLRILSIVTIQNEQVSDFQIYHELGVALSEGKGYTYTGSTGLSEDLLLYLNKKPGVDPVPTALRSPGMPILLAGIYTVFGKKPIFGKILNIFLSVFCGLCIYWIILPLSIRLAFLSSLIWMIYPTTVLSTNLLGTEIPFTISLLLCALTLNKAFIKHSFTKTSKWIIISGILAGIATLFRPAIYLLPCVIVVLILFKKNLIKTLFIISTFTLSFYLPQTVWGLRNYLTFGVFHGQANNVGPTMELRTRYLEPQKEELIDSLKNIWKQTTDEFEINKITQKISLKRVELAVRDGSIIKIIIKNFIKTWKHDRDPLEWSSISSFFFTKRPSIKPMNPRFRKILEVIINISYLVIILLSCLGSIAISKLSLQENVGFLFLIECLFVVTALLCIFTGEPRFHFTLLTTICILASHGIKSFPESFFKNYLHQSNLNSKTS